MDDKAVEVYAKTMLECCCGGYRDDRYWPPQEQAEWLMESIRRNWLRLEAPAAMRKLVENNFTIKEPFTLGQKPDVCAKCEGSGYNAAHQDRCECSIGKAMRNEILKLFQKPVAPRKVRLETGGSTVQKLEDYGFKRRKRKGVKMRKANLKRVQDLLSVLGEPSA
jgi:hypothetical protein